VDAPSQRKHSNQGLFVKSGTLIDASLIEADVKWLPQAEGEVSERDADAGSPGRGQRSFFGYKSFLARSNSRVA
jgi:transposase, IS5 family